MAQTCAFTASLRRATILKSERDTYKDVTTRQGTCISEIKPSNAIVIQEMKKHQLPPSFTTLLRRSFLRVVVALVSLCAAAGLCILYARYVEPTWISVKTVTLSDSPTITLIHISDTHYKGNRDYLTEVVDIINTTEADFVCFTGDLVEEKEHLSECIAILSKINKPLYGIPGNHDEWAQVQKEDIGEHFSATGGAWLTNGDTTAYSNKVILVGECPSDDDLLDKSAIPIMKTILLSHYPSTIESIPKDTYDLVLAGHTHGGQVCIPFIGNPVLSETDSKYARGLFHTEAGLLYVNSGIGTFFWPVRFLCRPEITVIEL